MDGEDRTETKGGKKKKKKCTHALSAHSTGALLDLRLASLGLACDLPAALPPLLAVAGPTLRSLDLGGNGGLTGEVGRVAAALSGAAPALAALSLAATRLGGDLGSACGLASSPALLSLDLSGASGITGPLPACLASAPAKLDTLRLGGLSLGGGGGGGGAPHSSSSSSLGAWAPSLTRISAPHTGLGGALPPSFPPGLVDVDLAGNALSGRLPPDPPTATLCALDLSGNALDGPIPAAYGEAAALTSISLARNRLGGVLPSGWAYRPALRTLDVSGNGPALNGSLHADWTAATGLRAFNASDNGLWGPVPPSLVAAPSLSSLALARNALGGGLAEAAAALPRDGSSLLRTLDLSGNARFDASPLPSASGLACLGAFQAGVGGEGGGDGPDGEEGDTPPTTAAPPLQAALSRAAAAVAGPPLEPARPAALARRPPPDPAARRAAAAAAAAAVERRGALATAAGTPRALNLGGTDAGGGGAPVDFPAWLVDALCALPSSPAAPAPTASLAGLALACPAGGIELGAAAWALPARARRAAQPRPAGEALEGLTCVPAGGGGAVPVASVVRPPRPPPPPPAAPLLATPTALAAAGADLAAQAATAARSRAFVVCAASLCAASAGTVGVALAVRARAARRASSSSGISTHLGAGRPSSTEPGEYCPEAGVVAALRVTDRAGSGHGGGTPKSGGGVQAARPRHGGCGRE